MEGTKVTAVREMNDAEYELLYWPVANTGRAKAIELSDGSVLIPSRDEEGNGDGFFAGIPDDAQTLVDETIEGVTTDSTVPNVSAHRAAPPQIELSNGVAIVPLADPEGNGPGALYQIVDDEVYLISIETTEKSESDTNED